MAEQFVNEISPTLTLSSAITTTSATTITPSSVAALPTSGTFRIRIDNEYMKASVSGSNLTVTRGDGGSTAATHNSGAAIYVIVSKEALDAICTILANGTEISNRRALNFIGAAIADDPTNKRVNITVQDFYYGVPAPSAPPTSGWTVLNSSASFSYSFPATGYMTLVETGNAGSSENIRFVYQTAPVAPYTITAAFTITCLPEAVVNGGLMFGDSIGGKLIGFDINFNSANAAGTRPSLQIGKWNSATSFNGNLYAPKNIDLTSVRFMRIADDGTNLKFSISADGNTFLQISSIGRTGFTANAPNQVGLYVDSDSASNPMALTCSHYVIG